VGAEEEALLYPHTALEWEKVGVRPLATSWRWNMPRGIRILSLAKDKKALVSKGMESGVATMTGNEGADVQVVEEEAEGEV
jgi:hypothetical protein